MRKQNRLLSPEQKRRARGQAGVTLIEMLVVVTIIALFVAIVAPKMLGHADQARVQAARTQVNAFMTALGAFKLDTGVYPTTEQGLAALRQAPSGATQWHGPYLNGEIPKDPWDHEYVYKYPGEHGDEPDIISYGQDGQPGGEGLNADILSWKTK